MEERQNFIIQMVKNEQQQKCLEHLYLIAHIASYWSVSGDEYFRKR